MVKIVFSMTFSDCFIYTVFLFIINCVLNRLNPFTKLQFNWENVTTSWNYGKYTSSFRQFVPIIFLTILNLLYRYLFKLQMLMQLRILASLLTKHLSFFLIWRNLWKTGIAGLNATPQKLNIHRMHIIFFTKR